MIYPLPREDQSQSLAGRYGWEVEEVVRFRDYKAPYTIVEAERRALICGDRPELFSELA